MLIKYFNRYNTLDENSIERILTSTGKEEDKASGGSSRDILVHGVSGKLIKAQTENQRKMVQLMQKNDLLFAVGPAWDWKDLHGCCFGSKSIKRERGSKNYSNKTSSRIR